MRMSRFSWRIFSSFIKKNHDEVWGRETGINLHENSSRRDRRRMRDEAMFLVYRRKRWGAWFLNDLHYGYTGWWVSWWCLNSHKRSGKFFGGHHRLSSLNQLRERDLRRWWGHSKMREKNVRGLFCEGICEWLFHLNRDDPSHFLSSDPNLLSPD